MKEKNIKEITFIINVLENFMKLNKKEQKESIKILKKNAKKMQDKENIKFVIKTLQDFMKKSYKQQLDIIEEFYLYRMEVLI